MRSLWPSDRRHRDQQGGARHYRAAGPAAPDPLFDPFTAPLEPRWWEKRAVARSGIAFGVLATVLLTFLMLPGSSKRSDRADRPAIRPPIDSGAAIITEPLPTPSDAPATASPADPSRTVAARRSTTRAVTTPPPRPANPPAPQPPAPTRSQPAPRPAGLTPLPPSREGELRSVNGDRATAIDFVNTRSQQVVVYWLDYRGRRVQYRVLGAGGSYRQPTYVTHPWVITRTDGRALVIFLPDRSPARATIT